MPSSKNIFLNLFKRQLNANSKAKEEAKRKLRDELKAKNELMLKIEEEERNRRNSQRIQYTRERKLLISSNKLQHGDALISEASAPFGTEDGHFLKQSKSRGKTVRYEQATCSCGGNNERCSRCFGSGFYTRKILEEASDAPRPSMESGIYKESSFSNDSRGGVFSVREVGRFSSNPLHDDHD